MVRKVLIVLAALCVVLVVAGVVVSRRPGTFTVQRSATVAAPPAAVFPQVDDLQAWDAWSPWKELDPNPKKTLSTPLVEIEQVFVRPLAGKARMAFPFAPEGEGTRVTWTMDAMPGKDFERGLASLKRVVEQGNAPSAT